MVRPARLSGPEGALSGRLPYKPTSEELNTLFETYILHELRAWLSYTGLGFPLSYFRTHDDVEVDVLLEDSRGYVAIEIKSTGRGPRVGTSRCQTRPRAFRTPSFYMVQNENRCPEKDKAVE
jgi:hypothetical protein